MTKDYLQKNDSPVETHRAVRVSPLSNEILTVWDHQAGSAPNYYGYFPGDLEFKSISNKIIKLVECHLILL